MAAEPAVPKERAEGIGARLEQAGDVVSLILNALFVACPAGGQLPLADALTVEVQLIEAETSGVKTGCGNFAIEREFRAQQGRGLGLARILFPVGGDPIGLPVS